MHVSKFQPLFVHPVTKRPLFLGKGAPILDDRTLLFKNYKGVLGPVPTEASYRMKITNWPMFLNDTLGCCTISAAGHMIQQWTKYAKSVEVIVPNSAILKGYEDVGGYVPGNASTDNGCAMLDVLNYWRSTGIGGHKIAAFAALNMADLSEVQYAISLFGNVYLGVQLPQIAQTQVGTYWRVPPTGPQGSASPGTWGGHCIPNMQFGDPNWERCITWGGVQPMTKSWLLNYADEGYAVITQDWIEANQKSPSGFDIKTLMADAQLITGGSGKSVIDLRP